MGVVYFILGGFVSLLGILIWRFEWIGLLSNVDQTTVVNKKGLARWAGGCILALSGIAYSTGIVLQYVVTERGELITCIGFMITSHLLMVVYLSGLHRYTK